MSLTRKQFLSLVASSVAISAVACGDDEDAGTTTGPGATSTTSPSSSTTGTGGNTTSGGGMGGSGATGGNAGGMGGSGGGGNVCTGDVTADIGDNHGHELIVPMADIMAGVEVTYTTTGNMATHNHTVTVTAADFVTLRSGGSVVLTSCTGIDHEYVLDCDGNAPAPGMPNCP